MLDTKRRFLGTNWCNSLGPVLRSWSWFCEKSGGVCWDTKNSERVGEREREGAWPPNEIVRGSLPAALLEWEIAER